MENNSTRASMPDRKEYLRALKRINRRLRNAIEAQHKQLRITFYNQHKDDAGFVICPVTGKRLRFNELSVDHVIPFWQLRNQWLRLRGIPIRSTRKITTEEILDWQRWHEAHAQLRVMDKATNKAMGEQWYGQLELTAA